MDLPGFIDFSTQTQATYSNNFRTVETQLNYPTGQSTQIFDRVLDPGKYYLELTIDNENVNNIVFGVASETVTYSNGLHLAQAGTLRTMVWALGTNMVHRNREAGSTLSGFYDTPGQGSVLMMALDSSNGKIWFGRNGLWGNGVTLSDISFGINPHVTNDMGILYKVCVARMNRSLVSKFTINFGHAAFLAAPPPGFMSLVG